MPTIAFAEKTDCGPTSARFLRPRAADGRNGAIEPIVLLGKSLIQGRFEGIFVAIVGDSGVR